MKKTIIIDGKKRFQNQYETVNITICNNKIIGMGYLPDDENCKQINAKNHLLVPNITNLGQLFCSEDEILSNNGVSNINPETHNVITSKNINKNIDFIIHPDLPYDEDIEKITTIQKNLKKPIITKVQSSEMSFLIERYKEKTTQLHLILTTYDKYIETTVNNNLYKNITFGLELNNIEKKDYEHVLHLLRTKKITSVTTKNNNDLIPLLYNIAKESLPEILYTLFDENFSNIFGIKNKHFALLQKPNLTGLYIPKEDSETLSILMTISKGTIKTS